MERSLAVIGVGNIANNHISGYLNNPNVELYAFCDINEERLKAKGAHHGVTRLYTSAEEMVNALPELDAVDVIYVMFSTPLICSSRGAITAFWIVSAEAPG